MATFPLMWLEVEGDDIHALRRGPPPQTLTAGSSIKSRFEIAQFRKLFERHSRRALYARRQAWRIKQLPRLFDLYSSVRPKLRPSRSFVCRSWLTCRRLKAEGCIMSKGYIVRLGAQTRGVLTSREMRGDSACPPVARPGLEVPL